MERQSLKQAVRCGVSILHHALHMCLYCRWVETKRYQSYLSGFYYKETKIPHCSACESLMAGCLCSRTDVSGSFSTCPGAEPALHKGASKTPVESYLSFDSDKNRAVVCLSGCWSSLLGMSLSRASEGHGHGQVQGRVKTALQ